MTPYNFAVLFFAFGAFLLGILIYLKRKDSLGFCYLLFSSAAAIWGGFFSIMVSANVTYDLALFCARAANGAALFIPIFWLHVAMVLSGNVQKKKLLFVYSCGAVISFLVFTPLFVPEVKAIGDFKYYTQAGPVFYFYTVLFFVVTPLGFYEIIKKIKRVHSEERTQLIGLVIATMIGFIAAFPTFLPCYGIDVPQCGLFFMPVYPFAMAYFMMRKDLFSVVQLAQAAHRDKMAAIGMLAASMNHEIRNPLYIIRGMAETHLEKFEEGAYASEGQAILKANEILKKAAEQTDRAMDLMRRFSMFAKQNLDQQFIKEANSVSAVLEDILPLIQHELMLDQIELVKQIPPEIKVISDRRHLEEVFFNLMVNACQAIKLASGSKPQAEGQGSSHRLQAKGQAASCELLQAKETGEKFEAGSLKPVASSPVASSSPLEAWGLQPVAGKIEIRAEQFEASVRIEITDNGPGIEEDHLRKIFDPFYTSKEEGTGLGLYITKQLVERNGGKISVKSKPGKGTTFMLEFKS